MRNKRPTARTCHATRARGKQTHKKHAASSALGSLYLFGAHSEGNHHYIWPLGPSCVAKRAREHFKSKQGIHLTPTLERNAPWSRRTVSFRSRRQRERPKSTGHSEGTGPSGRASSPGNARTNTLSTSPQHEKIINKQNFEGTSLSFVALHHKAPARALVFWREAPAFIPSFPQPSGEY